MSNEQPHDPTVTLRLELGRVTDQRDAFKAALTTEVLKVVRVAIIQATIDADNEIARLKAEVERLKEGNECLDQMHEKEMARSAFLCEQVERLTLENSQYEEHHKYGQNVITSLREEVERLRASSFVTAVPVEEYEKLKAEVDRLTDAITAGAITPDARIVP